MRSSTVFMFDVEDGYCLFEDGLAGGRNKRDPALVRVLRMAFEAGAVTGAQCVLNRVTVRREPIQLAVAAIQEQAVLSDKKGPRRDR